MSSLSHIKSLGGGRDVGELYPSGSSAFGLVHHLRARCLPVTTSPPLAQALKRAGRAVVSLRKLKQWFMRWQARNKPFFFFFPPPQGKVGGHESMLKKPHPGVATPAEPRAVQSCLPPLRLDGGSPGGMPKARRPRRCVPNSLPGPRVALRAGRRLGHP